MNNNYNLQEFLDIRTCNYGIKMLKDVLDTATFNNINIFSYINEDGNIMPNNNYNLLITDSSINDNNSIITDSSINEDVLMKSIVFNDNLLQYPTSFLVDTNRSYNIGDFSFMPTSSLCYYASQHIIKSLFLLDILKQLYNNTTSKIFKIKYTINSSSKWEYINNDTRHYNITLNDFDFTNDKFQDDKIITSTTGNLTIINTMFNLIKNVLKKHIKYINIADLQCSKEISLYYQFCEIMVNNKLFAAINKLAFSNTLNTHENRLDYDFTVPFIKTTNSQTLLYQYLNYKMQTGYILKYLINNAKNDNINNINSNTNEIIVVKTKEDDIIDIEGFKTEEYNNIELILNENNNSIKEIKLNNLRNSREINNIYLIKLNNYSSLYTNDDDIEVSSDPTKYNITWNNANKLLIIEINNNNLSGNIILSNTNKIYRIYNGTTFSAPSSNKKYSILMVGNNTTPNANNTSITKLPYSFEYICELTNSNNDVNVKSFYTTNKQTDIYNYNTVSNIKSLKIIKLNNNDIIDKITAYNNNTANTDKFYKNYHRINNTDLILNPKSFEIFDENDANDFNMYINGLINQLNIIPYVNQEKNVITNSMIKIGEHNDNIVKNSSTIKKNYKEYKYETDKLATSYYIEIFTAILFTFIIISSIIILIGNSDNKSGILLFAIIIFIISFIFFIIFNLKNTENFDTTNTLSQFYFSSKLKEKLSQIKLNIVKKTALLSTNKFVKPAIMKEEDEYKRTSDKYSKYKSISYNDADITRITKKRNNARIAFFINLSLLISICLILYVLFPSNTNIIAFITLFGIIVCVIILLIQLSKVVRTDSKKYYWQKPSPSVISKLN